MSYAGRRAELQDPTARTRWRRSRAPIPGAMWHRSAADRLHYATYSLDINERATLAGAGGWCVSPEELRVVLRLDVETKKNLVII